MEAKAVLRNCPLSPRKMRMVADLVRGQKVERALNILKFNQKSLYAGFVDKLIKSAVANWAQANGDSLESSELYVKSILVDGGFAMKRLRTAPQGRGYRMKKRTNHVTVVVDSLKSQSESNTGAEN